MPATVCLRQVHPGDVDRRKLGVEPACSGPRAGAAGRWLIFACAGIRSRSNNGRDLNQMFRDVNRDTEYIVALITSWLTSVTFLVAPATQLVILVEPPRGTGPIPPQW